MYDMWHPKDCLRNTRFVCDYITTHILHGYRRQDIHKHCPVICITPASLKDILYS